VRPLAPRDPAKASLDTFISLLFAIAADRPDDAGSLARGQARWLRRDVVGDVPVDVLLAPAVPSPPRSRTPTAGGSTGPTASTGHGTQASPAPMGGAVRYWLDDASRLRRLEALVSSDLPVRVDFDRAERPELTAIDLLGGRTVRPRAVRAAEAAMLSRLGQRSRAALGGRVVLTLPMPAGSLQRAVGWLDWRNAVAYLRLCDLDRPDQSTLVYADRTGIGFRRMAPRAGPAARDQRPALPPPIDGEWDFAPWTLRRDALGGYDPDILLNEALSLGQRRGVDVRELRDAAAWLRADSIDGVPVTVYEIRQSPERGVPRGQARLRYWIDGSGVLRRLELRTRIGAFAHLDVDPGDVPYLRRVPVA
jgi:hypothetical protein